MYPNNRENKASQIYFKNITSQAVSRDLLNCKLKPIMEYLDTHLRSGITFQPTSLYRPFKFCKDPFYFFSDIIIASLIIIIAEVNLSRNTIKIKN